PGLGGEVDDPAWPVAGEDGLEPRSVGDVDPRLDEAGASGEAREPRLLQGRVIITVHDVEADHGFAARQQRLGRVISDEAGRAGDENGHVPGPSARPPQRRTAFHSRWRSLCTVWR